MKSFKRFLAATATALLLSTLSARAGDENLEAALTIEKQIKATADKVVPAFVFIGGGSGVLISSDGWFLTNHHVAGEMPDWPVTLPGGLMYKAEIVGYDTSGDICLCKIKDAKDLPFVEIGDSDALKTGQPVIAVGNPFLLGSMDFHPSVSFGLVSAIHRWQQNYADAIQTDAAVNPGNSGGPLFTLDGKLIGINGRIDTRFMNRVNTGIGLAIPSNQIKNFMKVLKKGGYVRHGRIEGIQYPAEPNPEGTGAIINGVLPGSTAEKMGLKKGDLVTEVEGYKIHNQFRLTGVLYTWPGDTIVKLKLIRDGETMSLEVTLDGEPLPRVAKTRARLGATYKDSEDGKGIFIEKVSSGTDAFVKGLHAGDRIMKFNGVELKSAEEMEKMIRVLRPKKIVTLEIERKGETITIELMLASKAAK